MFPKVHSCSRRYAIALKRLLLGIRICKFFTRDDVKKWICKPADRLISIFRNNAGTPLSTLRSNAAMLKHKESTFPRRTLDSVVV